jgi:hypothetical protein
VGGAINTCLLSSHRSHSASDATVTSHDDPPEATGAPGPQDPGGLWRRGGRTRHGLLVFPRPAAPGADPSLPASSAGRTTTGLACLSPGRLWPAVFLHQDARRGDPLSSPAASPQALTAAACPERRGPPAPLQPCQKSPAPRPVDASLCRRSAGQCSGASPGDRHCRGAWADARHSG